MHCLSVACQDAEALGAALTRTISIPLESLDPPKRPREGTIRRDYALCHDLRADFQLRARGRWPSSANAAPARR